MIKIQLLPGEKTALLATDNCYSIFKDQQSQIITVNNQTPVSTRFFSVDTCFSGSSEQTVNNYLAKEILAPKSFSFFRNKRPSLPTKLEKEIIDFLPEIKALLDIPLQELSQTERYLVVLLAQIFQHPEVLVIDITSPIFNHHTNLPRLIGKLDKQTCLIITATPQQAFRLAKHILLPNEQDSIQEIDNHEKNEDTLAELWNWWYLQANTPPLPEDLQKLLQQQYI